MQRRSTLHRAAVRTQEPKQTARAIQPYIKTIGGVLLGLLLGFGLIWLVSGTPRAVPSGAVGAPAVDAFRSQVQPTPAPATAMPVATLLPANYKMLEWEITAYTSTGAAIGPIAVGRPFAVTGYDGEWAIAESPDWNGAPASGEIRLRAVDLLRVPPTPTPVPPTPTPAPPTQKPSVQVVPWNCVESMYGQRCGYGLNPNDPNLIAEMKQASAQYSASWLATKTAEAQQ